MDLKMKESAHACVSESVRAACDHIWASAYHETRSCASRDTRAVTHVPRCTCDIHASVLPNKNNVIAWGVNTCSCNRWWRYSDPRELFRRVQSGAQYREAFCRGDAFARIPRLPPLELRAFVRYFLLLLLEDGRGGSSSLPFVDSITRDTGAWFSACEGIKKKVRTCSNNVCFPFRCDAFYYSSMYKYNYHKRTKKNARLFTLFMQRIMMHAYVSVIVTTLSSISHSPSDLTSGRERCTTHVLSTFFLSLYFF